MASYPERGPKEIFATTGGFGGAQSFVSGGEGPQEIDAVIDIIFAHTDSDGRNTVARYVTRRLFEFFCHGDFARFATADMAATSACSAATAAPVSAGSGVTSTRCGASPCKPCSAMFRSLCSDFVGMPVEGPPRITLTMTQGTSAPDA